MQPIAYGDIQPDALYLVRAMSFAEYLSLTKVQDNKVRATARTNAEKYADGAGPQAAAFLDQAGFSGSGLSSRNTLHFSLNCVVQDHAYGKFSRDVLLVAPLLPNVERGAGPSSLNPVDVAFPFKEGTQFLHQVQFLVREDLLAVLPGGQDDTVHRFSLGEEQACLRRHLEDRGAPFRQAGMHGWAGHSIDPLQAASFAAALVGRCGHPVVLSPHAGTVEERTEGALARLATAASSIYQGEVFYEDSSGCELPNLDKACSAFAEIKALRSQCGHPNTMTYLDHLSETAGQVFRDVEHFAQDRRDLVFSDASSVNALVSRAPPSCREALRSRLADERQSAQSMSPELEKSVKTHTQESLSASAQALFGAPMRTFLAPAIPPALPKPPQLRS